MLLSRMIIIYVCINSITSELLRIWRLTRTTKPAPRDPPIKSVVPVWVLAPWLSRQNQSSRLPIWGQPHPIRRLIYHQSRRLLLHLHIHIHLHSGPPVHYRASQHYRYLVAKAIECSCISRLNVLSLVSVILFYFPLCACPIPSSK